MTQYSRYAVLFVLLFAVAGCSTVKEMGSSVGGLFGDGDNLLKTTETKTTGSSTSPLLKYAVTIRVDKYVDQRKMDNPRLLGVSTQRISGMSGTQLVLDQDLANVVTAAIKNQFDAEGFQVLEGSAASKAMYEVSGVIQELTLNVKFRDEITIAIKTTMKDLRSGEVVWSGLVTEKNDRFAGVAGNNKEDVVSYLNHELHVANKKIVEAISASLMASQPELFNLTPGTRPIAGVTVFVAPSGAQSAPASTAMPANTAPNSALPVTRLEAPAVPTYVPHASSTSGLLLVNTTPARAKVYLDSVYYGMSPLRIEMEPGIHAISVKLDGYRMVTEKVSVRKGDNTEMELNLER